MDKNTLVKDARYEGRYVAFRSAIDHSVIADGDNPQNVMRDAKKAGAEHPMIVFIPDKKMTCCY